MDKKKIATELVALAKTLVKADGNVKIGMSTPQHIKKRLEYLRSQLQTESISTNELMELESLAKYIEPGDVELLEPAGVPEGSSGRKKSIICTVTLTSDPVYFNDGTVSGDAAELLLKIAKNLEDTPHYSDGYSFDMTQGSVKAVVSIKEK